MMSVMRTTVTIDDDLAAQIEDLRRRERLSFKAALNRLLRTAIRHQSQPPQPRRYRTPTRKLGLRTGLDPTRLNQLADELESDDFTIGGDG